MRVGIIALQHESNTFIATPTHLEDFERDVLVTGADVRRRFADTHHELSGFFAELEQAGVEPVPIFAARTLPGGTITVDAYDHLLGRMLTELDRAGPLDGLLVAPHGAAVCVSPRDVDGHWLGQVRSRVGQAVPIICTIDPHANVSASMIRACDATLAYRTNPHLDQRECGAEAARLLIATLRGEVRPTQVAALPPLAINIEAQQTDISPCRPMYEQADHQLASAGVLSNSIVLGFPYADVEEMGSAMITVTDDDRDFAARLADEMTQYLFAHRDDFVGRFIDIEAALEQAERTVGPVCLLDMGDNVGGGSPADGTLIAHAIHARRGPRTFVALCDPEAVALAIDAGVGGRLELALGGKTDDRYGPPLNAEVVVRSVHEGRFTEEQARHGGQREFDMGPTVLVETAHGLTLQLTSRRVAPFSLNQITSCGLDPRSFQILVAKGVNAPVAAYAPVCRTFIRVNTPGATAADMHRFDYAFRRRPLFPLEAIPRQWSIVHGHAACRA